MKEVQRLLMTLLEEKHFGKLILLLAALTVFLLALNPVLSHL